MSQQNVWECFWILSFSGCRKNTADCQCSLRFEPCCMLFLIKCRQRICLFALAWLHGLRVSVCLREARLCLLFAPDQSPKTDKGWMLFCYEYFTLRLVSRFPSHWFSPHTPTPGETLMQAFFFRQQRPQQFKRISHQELSVRRAIPPTLSVTLLLLLLFGVFTWLSSHTDKAEEQWYWWVSL